MLHLFETTIMAEIKFNWKLQQKLDLINQNISYTIECFAKGRVNFNTLNLE